MVNYSQETTEGTENRNDEKLFADKNKNLDLFKQAINEALYLKFSKAIEEAENMATIYNEDNSDFGCDKK